MLYKVGEESWLLQLMNGQIRFREQREYNAPPCEERRRNGEAILRDRYFPSTSPSSPRSCRCADDCGYCRARYDNAREIFGGTSTGHGVIQQYALRIEDDAVYDFTEGVAIYQGPGGTPFAQKNDEVAYVYCLTSTRAAAERFCREVPSYRHVLTIKDKGEFLRRIEGAANGRYRVESGAVDYSKGLTPSPSMYLRRDIVFQKPCKYGWQHEFRVALIDMPSIRLKGDGIRVERTGEIRRCHVCLQLPRGFRDICQIDPVQ